MECSKEWLTVQDVATILDVDRRGVEKLINKKHLRAKNVSTTDIRKTWRIHPQWLEEFKESDAAEVD